MATSPYVWATEATPSDQHVAFRLKFSTINPNTMISIKHVCVSWYNVFLDGDYIAEGPTRFIGDTPYFATTQVIIPDSGTHVIAIHAHHAGVQTRMLLNKTGIAFCEGACLRHICFSVIFFHFICSDQPNQSVFTVLASVLRVSIIFFHCIGWM